MAIKTPKTTKTTPQTDSLSSTKRSQITYKKDTPVASLTLFWLRDGRLSIQERTRPYAGSAAVKRSSGRRRKDEVLTEKEKMIRQELAAARAHAERLMKLIE